MEDIDTREPRVDAFSVDSFSYRSADLLGIDEEATYVNVYYQTRYSLDFGHERAVVRLRTRIFGFAGEEAANEAGETDGMPPEDSEGIRLASMETSMEFSGVPMRQNEDEEICARLSTLIWMLRKLADANRGAASVKLATSSYSEVVLSEMRPVGSMRDIAAEDARYVIFDDVEST